MSWYFNKLINLSEVARKMGIEPTLLRQKVFMLNRNKLTVKDKEKLSKIANELKELISKGESK